MKIKSCLLSVRYIFSLNWWKCLYKYTRGLIRQMNGKYQASIDDFQWILNNGTFVLATDLLYEGLGISYACLQDFINAEEYLVKSSSYESQCEKGYLFMWLGYVYLIKERYEDSLNCFLKARQCGRHKMDKWLIDHKYVQDRVDYLEEEIRNKYKEILTNN